MFLIEISRSLLYLLILQFLISRSSQCEYKITNTTQLVIGINITVPSTGFIPRSMSANSLRIHFDYQSSFTNYPGSLSLIGDVLEPARLSLQEAITVKNPTNGILRVDRQCEGITRINPQLQRGCATACAATTICGGVTVPDKYLNRCKIMDTNGSITYTGFEGSGEANVDMVILVAANSCPSGPAYASSCFQESQLDRPILGIINICSGIIAGKLRARDNIVIIKHELTHALGFAVDKYAFYRNPDGTPKVPRNNIGLPNMGISPNGYYLWNNNVIVTVNRTRSSISMSYTKEFSAFVLPNVVAVAREHFNCPSITEVEVEEYGEPGSALSHFDEYVLYNEAMNAEMFGWNMRYSQFSLALLKDTGWYDVDYSKAESLDYGRNAGCILPLKGCYAYMESQKAIGKSIDPFCDAAYGKTLQCDPTRKYYGYCSITQDTSRLPQFRYLKSVSGNSNYNPIYFGGISPYSEYCPMKDVAAYMYNGINSDCKDSNNFGISNIFTPIKSSYGPSALCFDTTVNNLANYGSTCFNYIYDGISNNYLVCLGDEAVKCTGSSTSSTLTSNGFAYINCVSTSLLQKNDFVSPLPCQIQINTTPAMTTKTTRKRGYILYRYSKWAVFITFVQMYFH